MRDTSSELNHIHLTAHMEDYIEGGSILATLFYNQPDTDYTKVVKIISYGILIILFKSRGYTYNVKTFIFDKEVIPF
jgi:hypothetical protein